MSQPLTISTVNPKGGTGKTTIAVHLAVAACREGYSTHLVDTDPQGSALDWGRMNPDGYDGPEVHRVSKEKSVAPFVTGAQVVIVDSPARLDERTGAVLSVSDVALVPVRPSALDLWGTSEFLELLKERADAGLQAAFVASQTDARTTLTAELRGELEGAGLPLLDGLASRVAYARSMSEGETVLDGYNRTAADEVRVLIREVGELVS
ncbi:ParA family protein [Salinibacter altiplanensis]|uniref:ParA family protein n=1 Tax=Salinibacter altiplanensis TaxID=1803181 RepID=UPI00131A3CB5|nr:ParA family protein [Salinibacter altiplanensis]